MDNKNRSQIGLSKTKATVITCHPNDYSDMSDFDDTLETYSPSKQKYELFSDGAFKMGKAKIYTISNTGGNSSVAEPQRKKAKKAKSQENTMQSNKVFNPPLASPNIILTPPEESPNEVPNRPEPSPNDNQEKSLKLARYLHASKNRPKFFNSINSRHVLVLLQNKLYINGHIHMTLVVGNARVFGYELPLGKTVDIHSPQGYNAIFVESSPVADGGGSVAKASLSQRLSEYKSDFLAQDLEYIRKKFDPECHAVILLERNRSSTAVHMTERYMKETFIPNIDIFNSDNYYYSSEFVLHCRFHLQSSYVLAVDPEWDNVRFHKSSRVFVIGGKGVGKSTCIRYLINSNLSKHQKFLLIDLDVGQPELFLPQTVSATLVSEPILGPGFLQNIQPEISYFYGDINVVPSPIKYLKCVLKLYAYCVTRKDLLNVPWIINTMGYTRGLGPELIATILRMSNPTDVIQIQSARNKDNFESVFNDWTVNNTRFEVFSREASSVQTPCSFKTHILTSMLSNENIFRQTTLSKDIRFAMILAKLGDALKSNSDWLSTVKPFW